MISPSWLSSSLSLVGLSVLVLDTPQLLFVGKQSFPVLIKHCSYFKKKLIY